MVCNPNLQALPLPFSGTAAECGASGFSGFSSSARASGGSDRVPVFTGGDLCEFHRTKLLSRHFPFPTPHVRQGAT